MTVFYIKLLMKGWHNLERMSLNKTKTGMSKIKIFCLCLFGMAILIGCSSETDSSVRKDAVPVVEFADEQMEVNSCIVERKSIAQCTGDSDVFIVEYWYKTEETGETMHYGYCIKSEGGELEVIEEGAEVSKNYL